MRTLLYLLLCVASSSCLKRSTGVESPREAGTPPELDGSAGTGTGTGTPRLILDPSKTVTPVTDPRTTVTPITGEPEHSDATEPSESTEKPNNTSTGGGSLVVNTPAFSDATQLNAVVLTARCDNCLHPIKNDATELRCKIEGCRDSWEYVTHTTAPKQQHAQILCGRGDKTVAELSNLRLKCEFKHKKLWWRDYKHSDEFVLHKGIITDEHLCVITEDPPRRFIRDRPVPEVSIRKKNCADDSLSGKKHKLSLSFDW